MLSPASSRLRPALAAVVALLVLLVVSCTGDESASSTPADLGARLEKARSALDDAASLQIRLATDGLPDGTEGLIEAEGVGNHDPAFDGTVTVVAAGVGQVDAELVSVQGDVKAKIGFVPAFTPIDPDDYGAPDPAALLSADTGVSSWLTATEDLTAGEESRDGDDILATISGTLPGSVVQGLIPTADDAADFAVDFRVTDDDVLRDATITGPFYPSGDDVTYDLDVTASDETVDISLP